MIQARELRIGNYAYYKYFNPQPGNEGYAYEMVKIVGIYKDFYYFQFLNRKEITKIKELYPIPLTEEIMKGIRRIEDDGRRPFEFRCIPPGERQVENNYWSFWLEPRTCESRLHLSPCYDRYWKEGKVPKFWFCWYCGNGEWFLPIQEIGQLKYVHQLQNLFYVLTGKELEVEL